MFDLDLVSLLSFFPFFGWKSKQAEEHTHGDEQPKSWEVEATASSSLEGTSFYSRGIESERRRTGGATEMLMLCKFRSRVRTVFSLKA